ncbi:MAG: Hpt domain-containing protein [Polyangiaceae bacterium]
MNAPPQSGRRSAVEIPAPALSGRFFSIGAKLSLMVVLVLTLASLFVVSELSGRARAQLIEQKRTAANMVVDLFAATVSAAADFGDEEELKGEVKNLGSNQDIVYAAVWTEGNEKPVAELGKSNTQTTAPSKSRQVEVLNDRIVITHPLTRPGGEQIGNLTIHFTLEPENAQYERTRTSIMLYALGMAALLAVVVLGLVRVQVVSPLGRLSRGIADVQKGREAEVEVRAHDEVGRLAAAFNSMAVAIADRESRLEALNHRLQQLLDHMGEAILVFDSGGRVGQVQSKKAAAVFGEFVSGQPVVDLLFPEGTSRVEREAFEEWLEVAFTVPVDAWEEVGALAPQETTIGRGSREERVLRLDFRPIVEDGEVRRVMLLATDETDKRRLERAVRENKEEHQRQIAAMRKLVAGGGQLLVQVLDGARERLTDCTKAIAGLSGDYATEQNEELFRWAHTIKGEARAFDLMALEKSAATLEDELAKFRGRLREGEKLAAESVRKRLEPLISKATESVGEAERMLVEASPIGPAILDQVTVRRADLSRLSELIPHGKPTGNAQEIARVVELLGSRPFGESALSLVDSAPRWAARENKRVAVDVDGRDVPIPPRLARVLSGVLTHLVRNAVAHGVEVLEDRERLGKPIPARIRLAAEEDDRVGPTIRVIDDGRGLDHEALEKAAQNAALEKAALEQTALEKAAAIVAHQAPTNAEEAAFTAGITTKPAATSEGNTSGSTRSSLHDGTDLAGFGMGLSAVRTELRKIGYDARIIERRDEGVASGIEVILSPMAR